MEQILETLKRSASKNGLIGQVAGGAGIVAGALAVLLVSDATARWVLGGLLVVFGGILSFVLISASKRKLKVARRLADDPTHVVWAYPHNRSQGGQVTAIQVMVALNDGTSCVVPAGSKAGQQKILQGIQQASPGTKIGYSPELRDAYSRDPNAMAQ